MPVEAELHPTSCAICGTLGEADELYPANFDLEAFNAAIFSARRLPDRIHYRLVRCTHCGLVRSDPVIDNDIIAQLYAESTFNYGDELAGLRRTYSRYVQRLEKHGGQRGSLLEIGCGNGFVLEEALKLGYRSVSGVEPSTAAIAAASPEVREQIVCDIMRPGLFAAASLDAVCLFQVFDHIPNPAELLDECFQVLRPGGHILFLNHNIDALSARLLKERSPIVDLEHTYLYSPMTLQRLVEKHGFTVEESGSVRNIYSLHYLTRLLPLPGTLKAVTLNTLRLTGLGKILLSVPLGNLYLIARKPTGSVQ